MTEMFFGVLSLLAGCFLTLWGWRYSRRPDVLKPDSLVYRILIHWRRRRKIPNSDKLSDQEIKIYAGWSLTVGILLEIGGILEMVSGVIKIMYPNL